MEKKKVQLMSKLSEEIDQYVRQVSKENHCTQSGMVEMCVEIHRIVGHESVMRFLRISRSGEINSGIFMRWLDQIDPVRKRDSKV